jgi:hypothetical protein
MKKTSSTAQIAAFLLHSLTVAEEEGFDSVQYEGGACWHALVRYSREIENKEFTFCRINTGFPSLLTN